MRKLSLSLVAGALAVGGAAYAQPAERQPLTRAAAEQRSEKAFDRLDANHDGKLDQGDRGERLRARFDRVDANRDGSVSYAEFTAAHVGRDDGPPRGDHARRSGAHRMALHGGPGARRGMSRLADADKDGAITKAEFQAAALGRFDRLDADKDGAVTREEVKAARDSMRQRWQARREARQAS